MKLICRVAEISVPTFYRYFSDKYAIAEWATSRYARRPVTAMLNTATCEKLYRSVVDHALRYRHFYRMAYASSSDTTLVDMTARTNAGVFEEVIYRRNGVPRSSRLDFQIQFATQTALIMLGSWLGQDMPISSEDFVECLVATVPHELRELFDSFAQDPSAPLDG